MPMIPTMTVHARVCPPLRQSVSSLADVDVAGVIKVVSERLTAAGVEIGAVRVLGGSAQPY